MNIVSTLQSCERSGDGRMRAGEWPKATTPLFMPDLQILKGRRLSRKRVNANLKKLAGGSSSEKVRIESCWHHVGFITFFSLLSTKILYT